VRRRSGGARAERHGDGAGRAAADDTERERVARRLRVDRRLERGRGRDLVAVDGEEVSTPSALQTTIDAKAPGDTLTLRVVRGGATRTVTVTLGTRPS